MKQIKTIFIGICSLAALSSVNAQNLNDGLVAHYPFNGNPDNVAGEGNAGTLIGGPQLVIDRFGKQSSAYEFDGNDDYIDGGNPVENNPSVITQSAWIKTTATQNHPNGDLPLLTKRHTNDGSDWPTVVLNARTGNVIVYPDDRGGVGGQGGGGIRWPDLVIDVRDGNWHHVVGIKDGTTCITYVDGIKVSELSYGGWSPNGSSSNLHIGHQGEWNSFFKGSIDDIRIYSRALSGDEVSELYDMGSVPPVLTLEQFYEALPDETITIDATPESGFPVDFTYQWYFGTFLIPGVLGGNDSSRIIDANEDNNGLWRVVVSNSEGSAESIFYFMAYADTDGDGISDGREEFVIGSDPALADTDGDGIKDYDEVYTYGTSFSKADTDGDGFDDLFEINTKYDPLNHQSTPEAYLDIQTAVELKFNAAKDLNYKIENSVDLENWSAIETGVLGKGGLIKRLYSIDDYPGRYFRVKRE